MLHHRMMHLNRFTYLLLNDAQAVLFNVVSLYNSPIPVETNVSSRHPLLTKGTHHSNRKTEDIYLFDVSVTQGFNALLTSSLMLT